MFLSGFPDAIRDKIVARVAICNPGIRPANGYDTKEIEKAAEFVIGNSSGKYNFWGTESASTSKNQTGLSDTDVVKDLHVIAQAMVAMQQQNPQYNNQQLAFGNQNGYQSQGFGNQVGYPSQSYANSTGYQPQPFTNANGFQSQPFENSNGFQYQNNYQAQPFANTNGPPQQAFAGINQQPPFQRPMLPAPNQQFRPQEGNNQVIVRRVFREPCVFCGSDTHFIKACPSAQEYVRQGKATYNEQRQLTLPDGSYLGRDIPGRFHRDRFETFWRQQGLGEWPDIHRGTQVCRA